MSSLKCHGLHHDLGSIAYEASWSQHRGHLVCLAVANYHIFPFGRKPICCQRKQYEEDTDMLYSSLEVLATSILLEGALFQGRWHPAQYTLTERVEASVHLVQNLEFKDEVSSFLFLIYTMSSLVRILIHLGLNYLLCVQPWYVRTTM